MPPVLETLRFNGMVVLQNVRKGYGDTLYGAKDLQLGRPETAHMKERLARPRALNSVNAM